VSTQTDPRFPCPDETIWDEIASGLRKDDTAIVALEHASRCETCAQALRAALAVFALEEEVPTGVTPITAVPAPKKSQMFRWFAIAAAALLAVGIGLAIRSQSRPQDPLKLLARAYTAQRNLDLRLAGAGYSELRADRGYSNQKPTEAIEAELAIRRVLNKTPNDSAALYAKGRWEILYGTPDNAIESLAAARDFMPHPDANLLTEMAIAYRERGRRTSQAADLLHAVEILGQALQLDPDNSVALYDRALIEDELNLPGPAIADLERMLHLEPSGGWRDEARRRLQAIRDKHARLFGRSHDADTAFDEVALDDALQDLHSAGVQLLAERLNSAHHDPWLLDLLNAPDTPALRNAAQTLGRMTQIRLQQTTGRYQLEKPAFASLYAVILPPAFEAWRDYEELYRATHARGEFTCPQRHAPKYAEYKWLAVQEFREFGFCSFQAGDMNAAEAGARQSRALAEEAAFPVLAMRTAGLAANIGWRRGLYRTTIGLSAASLRQIVTQSLPLVRSLEFFNMMMTSAEDLSWWHAARAAAAQMTEVADATGLEDLKFSDTVRWAQLSLRCGDPAAARSLFQTALVHYSQSAAPRSVSRAWAAIGFADASGDESGLSAFDTELSQSPDPMIWVPYERLRATFALADGQLGQAQEHLSRVSGWLVQPGADRPASRQWRAELRQAREVAVEIPLREGKVGEAFRLLQQWKSAEERETTKHLARYASEENAVRFSLTRTMNRLAVWRVDGAVIDFRWASKPEVEVAAIAQRLDRLLQSPDSAMDEVDALAAALKDTIFGSWLEELSRNRTVIIQTDEDAPNLAFAVLPVGSSRLGLDWALAVTPLSFAQDRFPPYRDTSAGLLLVDASAGNPSWAPDLPPLPDATAEIAGIRAAVAGKIEVLQEDPQGMPGNRKPQILHFAGHAVRTGSGVALVVPWSPGPLLLKDLLADGFRVPPMVVLSACATGRQILGDSADSDSLAAAFLLEGSSEVIASLWSVDSRAAAALMTTFYRSLAEGNKSKDAMRDAMASLAHSPRFAHPHYWAMFTRIIRA